MYYIFSYFCIFINMLIIFSLFIISFTPPSFTSLSHLLTVLSYLFISLPYLSYLSLFFLFLSSPSHSYVIVFSLFSCLLLTHHHRILCSPYLVFLLSSPHLLFFITRLDNIFPIHPICLPPIWPPLHMSPLFHIANLSIYIFFSLLVSHL